jgi:hypothetical protein
MNWIRDFGMQEAAQPARTVEDASREMRQEFVDLFFGVVEQHPAAGVSDEHLHRIISQSLGIAPAGRPFAGYRHAIGRDIGGVPWQRVYDLISRLWPIFDAAHVGNDYLEGVNRILAAYGVAWELGPDGRLHRVLPAAAQQMVNAAFQELHNPQYAAGLQLMTNARGAYDDRPRRDRDACANAFDAMESAAKVKYNRPNDTFGAVKNYIEQNHLFRQEVINVLTALNGMRNGHFGHGMQDVFDLTAAEVDFVYLNCISVVILLMRTP